jgi:hypothetical protein
VDTITETTSEGIFSRLGSGLLATVLGILMVPGSIYLLYWNEGRAVNADRALDQGLSQLVEAKADSADVKLGAFHVDAGVLDQADNFKPLATSIAGKVPSGYRQEGDFLFNGGDIKNPAVGDIRVSFSGIAPQTFAIVAQDVAGTLSPYQAANGYVIALLEPGVVSGAQLFSERKQREGKLTWIFRGVGFVLMLVGFMMMMSFVVTLSSVIPFLSGLVEGGAFVIAITAAVPITLLTIAFAWLTLRPLIATPLILAAVGFFVMMHRRHRRPAGVSTSQTA